MQTNNLFLSLAIFSLVFSLLCIVFLCIWIYRDAKGRGQNGAVWILIAVTASPMIGLLAYFLAGRKEIRVPCQSCGWMVSKDARFCERCGTEQVSVSLPPQGKKQGNSFLPASIICFVLSILSVIGMVFASVIGGGLSSGTGYPSPSISIMSTNVVWNGEWKMSCYYCSDGYLKKDFAINDPSQQSLYTNITCEEGEIFLHVQQGDKKLVYDLTDVQGEFHLPLSDFRPGKVRVMIEVRGIKRLNSVVSLEQPEGNHVD